MVIKEDYKHSIPSSHTTRTRTCAPASGNNCNQTACSIRKLFDIKLNFYSSQRIVLCMHYAFPGNSNNRDAFDVVTWVYDG